MKFTEEAIEEAGLQQFSDGMLKYRGWDIEVPWTEL